MFRSRLAADANPLPAALVVVKKSHADGPLSLLIKGAPERVLERCTTYLDSQGQLQNVDEAFKKSYDAAYDYMASRGHRVIACAQSLLHSKGYPEDFEFTKTNTPFDGYTFVGLVSLEDPPKHGEYPYLGLERDRH